MSSLIVFLVPKNLILMYNMTKFTTILKSFNFYHTRPSKVGVVVTYKICDRAVFSLG